MLTSHLSEAELDELTRCPNTIIHRGDCCRRHQLFVDKIEDYLHVRGDCYSSYYVAEYLGTTRRTVERIRARLRTITDGRLGAYQGQRHARGPGF